MRTPINATRISNAILRLHRDYPGLPIGEHIAHALDGGDIYNTSDKELAEALEMYITSLDLDEAFQSDDIPEDYGFD